MLSAFELDIGRRVSDRKDQVGECEDEADRGRNAFENACVNMCMVER